MINQHNNGKNFATFLDRVKAHSSPHMTFSAYVRHEYWAIETGVTNDIPLDVLLKCLNDHYGTDGKIGAFKSALQRIRKEVKLKQSLGLPWDFDLRGAMQSVGGSSSTQASRYYAQSSPTNDSSYSGTYGAASKF